MTIFDLITPAQLMLTAIAVGVVGAIVVAFSRRASVPRNVRRVPREAGNTIERRPNVRRPLAPSCDCDAEARNAEIRALIDFPMREPCWADDEVTKVGGAA